MDSPLSTPTRSPANAEVLIAIPASFYSFVSHYFYIPTPKSYYFIPENLAWEIFIRSCRNNYHVSSLSAALNVSYSNSPQNRVQVQMLGSKLPQILTNVKVSEQVFSSLFYASFLIVQNTHIVTQKKVSPKP